MNERFGAVLCGCKFCTKRIKSMKQVAQFKGERLCGINQLCYRVRKENFRCLLSY